MFIFILFSLFSNAQAQSVPHAENYVNRHLSEENTRQEFQRRQMEVQRAHLEEQNQFRQSETLSESQDPYGVVYDSPNEGLPDFDKPARVYQANPMDQVRLNSSQSREQASRRESVRKAYVNQYLRNAKRDGAQVYINEDKIVFEAGKQIVAPRPYNASSH